METDLDKGPRRTTHEQLEGLLAFLCEHPSLAQGRKGNHVAEVWDICAEQLNAISSDPLHHRTGKGWAKFWHDYKYRLKLRATEMKISMEHDESASTAQRKVPRLSDLERNMLELIDFDVPDDETDSKIVVKSSRESNTSKDILKRLQVPEVQLNALLDFLKKHPGLAEGKSKLKKKGKLWDKCADKLNRLHVTYHKDGKGWANYWYNCKYKLKQLRKDMCDKDLPEFEQKILAMIDFEPGVAMKEEPDDMDDEHNTMTFVDVKDDDFQYSPVPSECSRSDAASVSYTLKRKNKRRRNEIDMHDDDDDNLPVKRRKDSNKELLEIEKQKLKLMKIKIESMNRLTDQISDMTTVLMDIRDRLPKP